MQRAKTVLLCTIAAIPLLAGCETNNETTAAPAFAESTERQSGPGSGGSDLMLVDVRVAEAEGFDRIVLKFSGTGTPGWVVNDVDEPRLDGSGEAVDLGGRAALDTYASGTTWPAPDYYDGPTEFTPEELVRDHRHPRRRHVRGHLTGTRRDRR